MAEAEEEVAVGSKFSWEKKKERKYCDIGSKNILGHTFYKKKKPQANTVYGYKSRPRTRIGKDEHS